MHGPYNRWLCIHCCRNLVCSFYCILWTTHFFYNHRMTGLAWCICSGNHVYCGFINSRKVSLIEQHTSNTTSRYLSAQVCACYNQYYTNRLYVHPHNMVMFISNNIPWMPWLMQYVNAQTLWSRCIIIGMAIGRASYIVRQGVC